ncbi:MAG: hypothetical protein M3291_10700, partial [Actinomycetota bacterium]|nr:hypothetical protein [Actinomycetota bacterium]
GLGSRAPDSGEHCQHDDDQTAHRAILACGHGDAPAGWAHRPARGAYRPPAGNEYTLESDHWDILYY